MIPFSFFGKPKNGSSSSVIKAKKLPLQGSFYSVQYELNWQQGFITNVGHLLLWSRYIRGFLLVYRDGKQFELRIG